MNVYRGAIAAIEERGWVAGSPRSGGGNVCILAALAVSLGGDPFEWTIIPLRYRLELAEIIREQYPNFEATRERAISKYDIPWEWNDRQKCRKPVIAILEKAAVREDERVV
jgi:hypothetical protein